MTQAQPIATEPVHLRLPATVQMDDDQFFVFCQANAEYRIERNADGEIAIMPPTGGETGRRNSDLITNLNIWARRDGTGVVFASAGCYCRPCRSCAFTDRTRCRSRSMRQPRSMATLS